MNDAATETPFVHYTTSQLVRMVMDKTGLPCKSRNRSALLKKLGLPAEKSDWSKNPVLKPGDGPCAIEAINEKKRATVAAKRKAKPAKKASRPAKANARPAKDKKPVRKRALSHVAVAPATTVRSDKERHAKALAAVKAAMSRREPPSLRALCAELTERGIEKPRGGTDWMPSSVQSLMRQAGYAAGGLPGKE